MLLLRILNETSRVVGFSSKGEINFSRCPVVTIYSRDLWFFDTCYANLAS
jgi:hypothetical protein